MANLDSMIEQLKTIDELCDQIMRKQNRALKNQEVLRAHANVEFGSKIDTVLVFVYGGNNSAIPVPILNQMASETGCSNWEYVHIPRNHERTTK